MNMSVARVESLTTDELTELDVFLLAGGEDLDRLMIDEAHGFLTALVVTGCPVNADEVIGELLGPDPFADEFEERRIKNLVERMQADIEVSLNGRQRFEPLVIEEVGEAGEIEESYEGWCFGFMLGVTHCEERWSELPKHEEELLTPIATLSLLHAEEEVEMDVDEYLGWVEMIPGSVAGLKRYFEAKGS